jgi:hypothetical protein
MGTSPWANAMRLPIINHAKVSSTKHFCDSIPQFPRPKMKIA